MQPFYGQEIDVEQEQEKINEILAPYRAEPVSKALKKKIYDTLQEAKRAGTILVPFKVVMRKHPTNAARDFIEVILDTKV